MKTLFDSEDLLVKNICGVVQLLLTNDIYAAKFSWLTTISGLSPDNLGLLSSYGTDKQLIMYHIRNTNYEFTCSSENCPSRKDTNDTHKSTAVVEDMTLHLPLYVDKEESVAAKSIKLWELGTSHEAAISCKKQFTSEPSHQDFISEIEYGKEIIRCSGWRIPSNVSFVNSPPFLTFDISIICRESIKTLDILPREINAYNETYRLGGITSYVNHRRHYVGYILHNGYFCIMMVYHQVPMFLRNTKEMT